MRRNFIALAAAVLALAVGAGTAAADAGGYQAIDQSAETGHAAHAGALADQTATNANVPVTIASGDVSGGPSSANQRAGNSAEASAGNTASTTQSADADQSVGGSGCLAGCGGAGGYQAIDQSAETGQAAHAGALADQTATNANVPVTIASGDVSGGPSSANQWAGNSAEASAGNTASTTQSADADQSVT